MRFAELHLLKYGHFEGCDLRFPKCAEGDLHIIYGPNEAGKSTTLAAASDFLFGFPRTTRFDFRFDKQLLRIGAVIDADGKQLSLRRRKGNSGTLLSEKDEPVSDALLAGLLKGQTAETFHRMFGLDHTRLRDGGQAILDAKDDVGQAIFAAGSGLVGIAELVESLDGQAKAIWTPHAAANRSYYIAQKAFDEARAKLKASQFKPARWDELRKAVEDSEQALDQFRAQRSALETSRQKLERQRRILPSVAKRKLLESSLDELACVPNFPPDASLRFAEIEKAITRGTADKQAAADRVKAATEKFAALVVDD